MHFVKTRAPQIYLRFAVRAHEKYCECDHRSRADAAADAAVAGWAGALLGLAAHHAGIRLVPGWFTHNSCGRPSLFMVSETLAGSSSRNVRSASRIECLHKNLSLIQMDGFARIRIVRRARCLRSPISQSNVQRTQTEAIGPRQVSAVRRVYLCARGGECVCVCVSR